MARAKTNTPAPEAEATADHLPETPPARKGHNGVTETELKALLLQMEENDTAMARIRQKGSEIKKRVEKAGGDWAAFKAVFKATKLSNNAAQEALETLVKYHAIINVRVSWESNGQGTLDDVLEPMLEKDPEVTRNFEEARAESDGYNSGRAKGTREDNPYPPGTKNHVAWDKGLRTYQSDASDTVAA